VVKKLLNGNMIFQKPDGLTKKVNGVERQKGGKDANQVPKKEGGFVVNKIENEFEKLFVLFHGG